jgi:hypothetical protein
VSDGESELTQHVTHGKNNLVPLDGRDDLLTLVGRDGHWLLEQQRVAEVCKVQRRRRVLSILRAHEYGVGAERARADAIGDLLKRRVAVRLGNAMCAARNECVERRRVRDAQKRR